MIDKIRDRIPNNHPSKINRPKADKAMTCPKSFASVSLHSGDALRIFSKNVFKLVSCQREVALIQLTLISPNVKELLFVQLASTEQ